MPTCAKYGKNHKVKCLSGSNACFGYGKMDHKIRNCPRIAKKYGDIRRRVQPYPSSGWISSGGNDLMQNRFHSL